MTCPFHVGQMVVCVIGRDDWRIAPYVHPSRRPDRGEIFVVRGFSDDGGDIGLLLEEIVTPPVPWRGTVLEPGFAHMAFRPVRTTNIDVFRGLVAPRPRVDA